MSELAAIESNGAIKSNGASEPLIMNDMVQVKDKIDPTKNSFVPKLLLQISIRELHCNLIELLPEATNEDGNTLISDTKPRQILPPHSKKMTDRYKVMCGCFDCFF